MHQPDQAMAARCGPHFLRQYAEREAINHNGHILRSVKQALPRMRALTNINMGKAVTQVDDLDLPAARPQRRNDFARIAIAAGRGRKIAGNRERDLALMC